MLIFDGHLDLAMNALAYERDQTMPLEAIRQREAGGTQDERGTAAVCLPELRAGNTAVCVASVLARAKPAVDPARTISRADLDWPSQDMAYAAAQSHLAYYRLLERRGQLSIITTPDQLDEQIENWPAVRTPDQVDDRPIGVILMMEGADPVTHPEQIHHWHEAGLRAISLAHFGPSHYAMGTPAGWAQGQAHEPDAPLAEDARTLLREMSRLAIALDLTHLYDRSFEQAIEVCENPVCATHSNCRHLCPGPRQLTDRQLRLLMQRDGVIGAVGHAGMIQPNVRPGRCVRTEVPLKLLAEHIDHICQLAGDARHAALGSDLDGGFGIEYCPAGLDRHRDLHQLGPCLRERGYTDTDLADIFYRNWQRFYRRVLAGPDEA